MVTIRVATVQRAESKLQCNQHCSFGFYDDEDDNCNKQKGRFANLLMRNRGFLVAAALLFVLLHSTAG